MISSPVAPPAFDSDDTPAGRILRAAREQLFSVGYSALTMDGLAHELGMSKKTLYAHFASKDAIVAAILDTIEQTLRRQLETILGNDSLGFAQKLSGVTEVIGAQYASGSPLLLRDLQRFAPPLYRKIDDVRNRLTPSVMGRLLGAGVAAGMVRPDIDLDFAVQFLLQALTGLLRPESLQRLGLSPRQAFEKGIGFFFDVLLTEAGRIEIEKARSTSGR